MGQMPNATLSALLVSVCEKRLLDPARHAIKKEKVRAPAFMKRLTLTFQDGKLLESWELEMTTVSSLGTNEIHLVDLAAVLTYVLCI